MHPTEERAFKWLLKQGYQEEEITYQGTKSPDFVLKNGEKYEVKTLHYTSPTSKRRILFSKLQFEKLTESTLVLVYDVWSKDVDPIVVLSMEEIKENYRNYNGIVRISNNTTKTIPEIQASRVIVVVHENRWKKCAKRDVESYEEIRKNHEPEFILDEECTRVFKGRLF